MAELSLWIPDSAAQQIRKQQPLPLQPRDESPVPPPNVGRIRSALLPMFGRDSLSAGTTPGIGSPVISQAELIGLWRQQSWVRAAIRRIAMISVQPGWEIVRPENDPDSGSDEEYDYLYQLFQPDVSEITNIRQWQLPKLKFYVTFARLRLLAECHWEIVKNGFGDVVDFALMFHKVVPVVDRYGNFSRPHEAAYIQVVGQQKIPFFHDEVLRFEISDIDGRLGVSDLESLQLAASTDLYASVWNRNTFKNNRTPPGAYMFDASVSDDDMAFNLEMLDTVYGGVEGANKPYIAFKGVADYKTFGGQPRDAEYLRGREFSRDEELAVLGTPAGVLGMVKDVNRSNLEGLTQIVYEQESKPLQEIVQDVVNLWIGTSLKITGWEFRFRSPNFTDEGQEARNAQTRLQSGQSTINMELKTRGLDPVPGGNRFYMPAGMVEVAVDTFDADGMADVPELPGSRNNPDEVEPEPAAAKEPVAARAQVLVDELRRWKRVASKVQQKNRLFRTYVLPEAMIQEVEAALREAMTPVDVRAYFDGLIRNVETGAWQRDELTKQTAERVAEEWPAWAQDRFDERQQAELTYSASSRDDRTERLEVGVS